MATRLRVMSYNVRYFGHALRGLASTQRSKLGIARGIASLRDPPDVICLQEVETISLRATVAATRRRPGETQLETFMDALEQAWGSSEMPYEALHFRAHTYGPARWPVYTTGLAVLVNTRAMHIDAHNAHSPEAITHHVAQLRGLKQSRICAHVRLRPRDADEAIHVFNTHLSLPSIFAQEFWDDAAKMGRGPNQLAESRSLARFVREGSAGEPFVVVGDFNSAPATPVYQRLVDEEGWRCAQADTRLIDPARRDGFATAGFMRLRMHLDHVFGGNGVRFEDMEGTAHFDDRSSPFYGLSDHAPLLARLAANRAQ